LTWATPPLGSLVETIVPARDKPTELVGPIPWVRIEDFDGKYLSGSRSGQGVTADIVRSMPLRVFPSGTVVCSCSCTMGITAIVTRPLVTNQTFIGLVPRTADLSSEFLYYALQGHRERLTATATGAIQSYLGREDFRSLHLPIPDISMQRAIADYLDHETGRIDVLLGAKRRMVAVVEEQRRANRELLVLDGWRANSGLRLGQLLREMDERLGAGEPLPLLSVSIHHGVIPFAEANPDRMPRADDLRNYKKCKRHDIILNRMRAFQGGLGRATVDGLVSPDYAVLRPSFNAFSGYLEHLLRSPWFVGQMERLLRGIGGVEQGNVRTPRVNWDDLRTIRVPLPPHHTQVQLAEQLDSKLSCSWRVQKAIERQVGIIQERRQALITAAVTGQLDIPEAA
jgi:type I restriction enzyme, S subunit